MLALRKVAASTGVSLADIAEPSIGASDVLIEVVAAGICGSDLHVNRWTSAYAFMANRLPITLGHEFSGRVVEKGALVTTLAIGDRITAWPSIACGTCDACRHQQPSDCEQKSIVGLHRDGGFARFVSLPAANCFVLPDALDFETAALTEPLAVSARAIEAAGVGLGHAVVVIGPGPIGIGAAWLAKLAGANPVILVGLNDAPRLNRALALGADYVIDVADEPLGDAVQRYAGGKVDVVIEASGSTRAVTDGLSILKTGGVVMAIGIYQTLLQVDLTALVRSKHQLRTSHDSRRDTWHRVLGLLAKHGNTIKGMITHRCSLAEGVDAFSTADSGSDIKVMLEI